MKPKTEQMKRITDETYQEAITQSKIEGPVTDDEIIRIDSALANKKNAQDDHDQDKIGAALDELLWERR